MGALVGLGTRRHVETVELCASAIDVSPPPAGCEASRPWILAAPCSPAAQHAARRTSTRSRSSAGAGRPGVASAWCRPLRRPTSSTLFAGARGRVLLPHRSRSSDADTVSCSRRTAAAPQNGDRSARSCSRWALRRPAPAFPPSAARRRPAALSAPGPRRPENGLASGALLARRTSGPSGAERLQLASTTRAGWDGSGRRGCRRAHHPVGLRCPQPVQGAHLPALSRLLTNPIGSLAAALARPFSGSS